MKKQIITLSAVAALATSMSASTNLEDKILELEQKIQKLEKTQKKEKKKLNQIKKHTSGDNLKFKVDFRNQIDFLEYTNNTTNEKSSNDIITSRLDLSMVSSPVKQIVFKGKIGVNNVWGGHPAQDDPSAKDWQSSNKANDHTVKVKEAIVIYKPSPGLLWSLGRRPSSDGFLANHRQNTQNPNSPLAHVTNMEVDAGMIKLGEKYTKLNGSFVKIVAGRAHDPAKGINDYYGYAPYANDAVYDTGVASEDDKDVNFIGLLGNAYDDGKYRVMFQRMLIKDTKGMKDVDEDGTFDKTDGDIKKTASGEACLTALSLQVDGVSESSDFLSETVAFVSIAQTEYDPKDGYTLLGSNEKEKGHSIWLGATFPDMMSNNGRIGIEYNKGSKYWTPMTWAEDTMIGSKIAVRGDAAEIYWNTKIGGFDNLSAQIRHTIVNHEYTPNVRCSGWVTPQEVDITAQNTTFSVRYQY